MWAQLLSETKSEIRKKKKTYRGPKHCIVTLQILRQLADKKNNVYNQQYYKPEKLSFGNINHAIHKHVNN
jgi:hypothetical protein